MKGKLTITVIEAKELKDTELIGKMDPYTTVEIGKEKFKTKVQKKAGKTPHWNQTFIFNLEGKEDALHVNVFDEELISDDHIGRVDIPLTKLVATNAAVWYQLIDRNDFHKVTGQLAIRVDSFVGTGAPAAEAAAAPSKEQPVAAPQVVMQPQVQAQAQPQMVYAQPQQQQMMYAQQPQQQMMYAPQVMAQPQTQLVRGTDGKLYAIQQPQMQMQMPVQMQMPMQPQVVYVQTPQGMVMQQQPMQQQPRYM